MSKKILVVLSEYGYWGEELVGPLEVLDDAGYEVTFMTPTGQKPPALPPSMEPGFWDPPLDKVVTDEYYANLTRQVAESDRLANPIDLSSWFPQRNSLPPTLSSQRLRRPTNSSSACCSR